MSRPRGRLAVSLVVALAVTVALPTSALGAQRALDGELLFYSNSQGFAPSPPLPTGVGSLTLSTTCDDTGTGDFTYSGSGNANGSLAGTFTVSGSGSFADGVLQALDVDFAVTAGSNVANGSLQLDPAVGDIFGSCTTSIFDWDDDGFDDTVTNVSVGSYVSYSADVDLGSGIVPESGKALWQVRCFTVNAEPACDLSETTGISIIGGSVPRQASGVESASTASMATATDPIATSVTGPAGSQIEISEAQVVDWPWAPSDFELLGREVNIYVYDEEFEDIVTPVDDPIVMTFVVYNGLLQELGISPADVTVLRDGEPAGQCAAPGNADPDPCVESRSLVGDQLTLTVLSTHASTWSIVGGGGSVDYTIDGFFSPVENPGTTNVRNVVKAGQSVALRWRVLADDQPVLDVASATATTVNFACGKPATSDAPGVVAGNSGLQNLGNGYYQFNWKTPKGYANSCKTMTLGVDVGGSTVTKSAIFEFKN